MVREIILKTFNSLEKNNFKTLGLNEPMWEEPLIGVSLGKDTFYEFLNTIGAMHF